MTASQIYKQAQSLPDKDKQTLIAKLQASMVPARESEVRIWLKQNYFKSRL